MIRLLADENIVGLEQLPEDEVEVHVVSGRDLSPARLQGFDALWVRSVSRVDEALIAGSTLRFIGTATAGLEHIDQQALAKQGIAFAAAPGANANAVVEYVLAALAELREPWERLEQGGTLGIVGYGAVGRLLAGFAGAMGWNVLVSDPFLARSQSDALGPVDSRVVPSPEFCPLEDILDCCVISLHCSLHRQQPWPSHHLLGAQALSQLNSRQWLINAARGPVVDNRALLEHLSANDPVNCVLDVWEDEPAFAAALLGRPTLRLTTPHIAGYSWDAKWQATCMLYSSLRDAGLVKAGLGCPPGASSALQAVSGEGLEAARALIGQRYRIDQDNARFRTLAQLPDAERSSGFDRLRRDYPQRRELRGSVLQPSHGLLSPTLYILLGALGIDRA
ncbi:MAG: erythronate-4-phosphate dehydrogenase [Halieaceae bacterium]|jgi:erythronate-4-phosphate dehydrogenase